MSDRTEDEEERYIRRVARRMPVQPERLLDHLRPQGFLMIDANRDDGINEIVYLRNTPGLPDFFDIIKVDSNIHGEDPSVTIYQSILPTGHQSPCVKAVDEYVPATRYGYQKQSADFSTTSATKRFERRLAEAVPMLFSDLFEREGRALYDDSRSAREAAERYLSAIKPNVNLVDTFDRLKARATPEQWSRAQSYVQSELLSFFRVEDFKVIWNIAGLAQVVCWERDGVPFRGLREVSYVMANEDDIEAHRRFQLVSSRLARNPGWPMIDPLVPNRRDLEEQVYWRDGKPSYIAELFDEHLAASEKRCDCGKSLYYVRHHVRAGQHLADVLVRCTNGHEASIEVADIG